MQHKRHLLPYLQVMTLYKQWQELTNDIEEFKSQGDQDSQRLASSETFLSSQDNLLSNKTSGLVEKLETERENIAKRMLGIFVEAPELFPQMIPRNLHGLLKSQEIRADQIAVNNQFLSEGQFCETRAEEVKESEIGLYFNIFQMSKISFETLEGVYRNDFPSTEDYKELVIRLHDNVIEYSFLSQAGLIKPSQE